MITFPLSRHIMQGLCEEKQMRISIQRTGLVFARLTDEISILLRDAHNLEASARLQNKLKFFIPELIDPQKTKDQPLSLTVRQYWSGFREYPDHL